MTMTIIKTATDSVNADGISTTLRDEVNSLAMEYRRHAKAAAEGILKLAEILGGAESDLAPAKFVEFLRMVGLEGRESTVSKHRTIGKATERLRTLGEALPNSWTTLYQLAKLSPEQFETMKGEFSSQMTAMELRQLLHPNVRTAARNERSIPLAGSSCSISIRFEGGGSLQQFLDALDELRQRFSFEVVAPETLPPEKEVGSPTAVPVQEAA